jgi:ABC-type Na+ efflux pump permease subunit
MGSLSFLVTKYLVTAALVVIISEVAKHLPRAGALIAALPVVTILVLVWLYLEDQSEQRIADHAFYTFWYVLPTLPMFLVFPTLLSRFGFWLTLGLSALITIFCFGLLVLVARGFGIELV